MTIKELEEFGFKQWKLQPHDNHDRSFFYTIRDSVGQKLTIHVKFWAFSRYDRPDNPANDSFSAECQYDIHKEGGKVFNVSLNVNDMTPAEVLEWFSVLFERMGCEYYERY